MYIFLLKSRILFDLALGLVNKYSKIAKIILKKSFEIGPGQGFYLTLTFVLELSENDLLIRK